MKLLINGIHFEVNERTKEYTKEKYLKLEKYCDFLDEIDVKFKSEHKGETTVEAIVTVKGEVFKASHTDEGMLAAVDKLYDILELKLTKIKEKAKEHAHEKPGKTK